MKAADLFGSEILNTEYLVSIFLYMATAMSENDSCSSFYMDRVAPPNSRRVLAESVRSVSNEETNQRGS